MLREVQKGVKKQIEGLKQDQKKINASIENEVKQLNKKITEDIKKMAEDIKKMADDNQRMSAQSRKDIA